MRLSIHWFRRDLRLEDNTALYHALRSGQPVLPIFIFDHNILKELPVDDARMCFIYSTLLSIHQQLREKGSGLLCLHGDPEKVWHQIIHQYDIQAVYTNKDYEPYAIHRDQKIKELLHAKNIAFHAFKDHVIYEENEMLKPDGKPYTVFTPYKRRWLQHFQPRMILPAMSKDLSNYHSFNPVFPALVDIGFQPSAIVVKDYTLSQVSEYADNRDFPAMDATSYLSPHLRFGTVSIRHIIRQLHLQQHEIFLSELIWREFFMQILYHFPHVVNANFRVKYNGIVWRNNTAEFEQWCAGQTGYPLIDAGMRQLNTTGYMHNRVRMVVASFLCKHLLIDWQWGEAYFAKKLLDYELSSNNGNWQWAAGTGCDAAPYFRVFNPTAQLNKFDKDLKYTRKWVSEYEGFGYVQPIVEHAFARARALKTYKAGITK